jgi:hypothetical protein
MRRTGVAAGLACAALALTGCGSDAEEERPARPAAVALDAEGLDEVRVGVVVSVGSQPLSGTQWVRAAEGTQVAAHRFELGGTQVVLEPVDDRGTAEGLAAAVQQLEAADVGAIVVATDGEHVTEALPALADAAAPVLLPYWSGDADLPEGVWDTGLIRATADERLVQHLDAAGLATPVLVDAGGGAVAGLDALATVPATTAAQLDDLVERVEDLDGAEDSPGVDSVVVSGPALLQGRVVAALGGSDVDVPVLLSHDALSPVLAAELQRAGASLSTPLVSVGADVGDVAGTRRGGDEAAAFFEALRSLSADEDAQDLLDGEPYATVAGDADTVSHDAVVAAVRAAQEAGSVEPAEVEKALAGLTVDGSDGLVGPTLDFGERDAAQADGFVALQSTSQDPQVREEPTTPRPRLFWFPVPEGS